MWPQSGRTGVLKEEDEGAFPSQRQGHVRTQHEGSSQEELIIRNPSAGTSGLGLPASRMP